MMFSKSASSFSSDLVQLADQPGPILHTAANAAFLTSNYFLISLQSYSIFFLFNFLLTDLNTFIIIILSHSILFFIVIVNDDIFSKEAFVMDMVPFIS